MVDEYIRKAEAIKQCGFGMTSLHIADNLRKMRPADVVPVRHGKWTHKPDVYGVVYCSECNYELHANSTSFCPNCGAKMDGGEDENG